MEILRKGRFERNYAEAVPFHKISKTSNFTQCSQYQKYQIIKQLAYLFLI